MPIFNNDDEPVVEQSLPDITHKFRTNEELKTSLLFDKENDLNTIVQFIKGMEWSVDYFLQIRNINDVVKNPDINTPSTIQKYHRINKLVLNLQTAINQDDFENIVGECVINAGFMPSVGDAFKAVLTGGREAIFVLTDVNKRNYNLQNVYLVNFKLFTLLDNNNIEIYNDIVYKTIKEYVYDRDHLLDYSSPVILANDYKKKINLKIEINNIIDYYLNLIINKEKKLLLLPTETSYYYDVYLTDFIYKILDVSVNEKLNTVTRIEFEPIDGIDFNIWDVIINRDTRLLEYCSKNIGFKYTPINYNLSGVARHISILGINFIVGLVDTITQPPILSNKIIGEFSNPYGNYTEYTYVLSDNFYKNDKTNCSKFEKILLDYLEGSIINSNDLEIFISEYKKWNFEHQYYLIPILILLIKDSINNTFTQL